jgi:hypothetical protein
MAHTAPFSLQPVQRATDKSVATVTALAKRPGVSAPDSPAYVAVHNWENFLADLA